MYSRYKLIEWYKVSVSLLWTSIWGCPLIGITVSFEKKKWWKALMSTIQEKMKPHVSLLMRRPAACSAMLLEKQQYLQNIIGKISGCFPELVFILGFDWKEQNVPLLTIYQKSLFSHPPHGIACHVKITVDARDMVCMSLKEELCFIDEVFEC